jgi:hypothetical protein
MWPVNVNPRGGILLRRGGAHIRQGPSTVIGLAIPAIQLTSAAITFALWLAIPHITAGVFELLSIRVFSISTVLCLPATAGIIYLIPNYFRSVPIAERKQPGPWSGALGIAVYLNISILALGGLLTITSILLPSLRVTGCSLVAASAYSHSLFGTQMARIRGSLWEFVLATLPNVFLPAVWIVLSKTGIGVRPAGIVFFLLTATLILLSIQPYRSMILRVSKLRGSDWPTITKRAAPMVPHLLAFAALMQGPRLINTFTGNNKALVGSHQVMLLLTVGTTVIASFHGILSVGLQTASESEYPIRLRVFALQYWTLGATASLATAVFLAIFSTGVVPGFPHLGDLDTLAVIAAPAIITVYFAMSAQVVREGRTSSLPIVSCTVLVIYGFWSFLDPSRTLHGEFIRYGICLALLPVLLPVLLTLTSNSKARSLIRSLKFVPISFIPTFAVVAMLSIREAFN